MDFRKRYKISLYILIPFVIVGFALLIFFLSFYLGQGFRNLESQKVLTFLFVTLIFAGFFGFLIAWIVLNPIEKFLKEAGKSPSGSESAPAMKKAFLEKDELDRFEEAVFDVTNTLSVEEAKKLFPEIAGESRALRAVLKQCALVAPTDTTVLITGESGTGKELLASAIHRLSDRKGGPFIKVNCVAIPEGLLESELFGHEKGAFTGATAQKKGKFEIAQGGTIFLDEIGDMPLNTQAKILRVIQEREFERVGGNEPLRVNVRIVAATNHDLSRKVREKTFREDLFHRVNVFGIEMPPLRKRGEDIPSLMLHFAGRKEPAGGCVTPGAESALMAYDWPGNVRELRNALERAAVLAEGMPIRREHLPAEILHSHYDPSNDADKPGNLNEKMNDMERGLILDALRKSDGVQVRAAECLGISQRSLWHRIKKLNIDVRPLRRSGD